MARQTTSGRGEPTGDGAAGGASGEKAFHVSWDQFHRDARVLAWRLGDGVKSAASRDVAPKGAAQTAGAPFEAIVCITRGGLVPAAIVARELGIRVIETISLASYDHNRQGEVRLLKPIGGTVQKIGNGKGRGILVVDDLTDTGKTAKFLRNILPDAHYAAVYAKPAGAPLFDTWVTEVSQDTWIYFPWDLGLAYQPPLKA